LRKNLSTIDVSESAVHVILILDITLSIPSLFKLNSMLNQYKIPVFTVCAGNEHSNIVLMMFIFSPNITELAPPILFFVKIR